MSLCRRHKRLNCGRCQELDHLEAMQRDIVAPAPKAEEKAPVVEDGVTSVVTKTPRKRKGVTPAVTVVDLSGVSTEALRAELARQAKSGADRTRAWRSRRKAKASA